MKLQVFGDVIINVEIDHNIVKYRHNGKLIIIHFDINLKHTVLSVNQDPRLNNSNNLGILEDAVKKERIKKMLKR